MSSNNKQVDLQKVKNRQTITWLGILVLFLVLIFANFYLSRSAINELGSLQAQIRHSSQVVDILQNIHVNLLATESGQRGFLLTKDPRYLNYYNATYSTVSAQLDEISEWQSEKSEHNQIIQEASKLITQKLNEMETTVDLAIRGDYDQALSILNSDNGLDLYTQIHSAFTQVKHNEKLIAENQIDRFELASQDSQQYFLISIVTSAFLLVGIFILARTNIAHQQRRQKEIEFQNVKLQEAVALRTKELSLFSEELKKSNRELEDFAFVASHDLQEPLRKIMTFTDRLKLQGENFTERQHDYLERMNNAANRMSTLISDLLEYSRVATRGKGFQKVNLNVIIDDCIDDLNILIEETNAQINISKLPEIDADPTQMRQLFFNLLGNAIKFSQHENSPLVDIIAAKSEQPKEIEGDGMSDWVTVSIIDNGIGFEQEFSDKIFTPFQRLHSRQKYKGTGIGLAICRRIVERHNGIITAVSEPEKGAKFMISLPINNTLLGVKN